MRLISAPLGNSTGHEKGRQLLEMLYGAPLPPIEAGSRGKPHFVDSSLHFSITHTDRRAFCALSDSPIGIDAEELDRKISPRLAEKILSPSEYAQYEKAEDKRLALLTFWVLKEAYYKFTGEGIRRYPNKTAFSLDDPRVTIQDGCLLAVVQEDRYAL